MTTPRTLKSAIENGYVIDKVIYAGSPKCRVDLKAKYFNQDKPAVMSFWMTSSFVKREYPKSFSRASY